MTTDTNKLIRHLTERIEYCKLKDNRTSRDLWQGLLDDVNGGKFAPDERTAAKTIAIAKEYGFCCDCINYANPPTCEPCVECLDSISKNKFKPKEDKQNANE
jgi:hypothetical protein